MEQLTPSEIQRLLEEEGRTLQIMGSKLSNQIHLLQVEEELFRQELEKLQREGQAKDYPNQQGVNKIVDVTNAPIPLAYRYRADGVDNIVEIANDDLPMAINGAPEVPQENGAEGVNQIIEITCDEEDEIMRESNSEGLGQALKSSLMWLEKYQPSNLQYQIVEPSSDESEADVGHSNTGMQQMLSITLPSDVSGTVVGEKRHRLETSEAEGELNSGMEVEESSDDKLSHGISPARSPPRKKQTPQRKTVGYSETLINSLSD